MERTDNFQNYLTKNQKEAGLEETLENILKINQENKQLIRNIDKKETDQRSYEDNKDKDLRDEFLVNLQKQISLLQENFEEMKQKIFNNYNTKEMRSSNITELSNRVKKSETFSKQFF